MKLSELVEKIADELASFDSEFPTHKSFKPGIGPFGEPQIVKEIARRLNEAGHRAVVKRSPDLVINDDWAIEFKIVRPFGDNGKEAEDWSVNMLHPYPGNASALGDVFKLLDLPQYPYRAVFILGFEHDPAKISLNPLLDSFELIAEHVLGLGLSKRIEARRWPLVHPEHQILRCLAWEVVSRNMS